MKKVILLSIIFIVLLIIGGTLAGYRYYQYQKNQIPGFGCKAHSFRYEKKMRKKYHYIVEKQSLQNKKLQTDLFFNDDTLMYSMNYLYETGNTTTDWIRKGKETVKDLDTIVQNTGAFHVEIKLLEKGIHLYSIFYDFYYCTSTIKTSSFRMKTVTHE